MSYTNSKTLDTIYLPERLLSSDAKRISEPDEFGRGIKFIRAEALLEWANGMSKAVATLEEELLYRELIEHIESL